MKTVLWLMLILLPASVGTGCFGLRPAPDITRHLLLSAPPSEPIPQPHGAEEFALGLAAVALPEYLRSPWMAVRAGDNEIRYSGVNRWGERLDHGVRRVLATSLGRSLSSARVEALTWRPGSVRCEISVEFQHCEAAVDGRIWVQGSWRIIRPLSTQAVKVGHHRVERAGPQPDRDPAGAAAALSEALGEFGRQLAVSVAAAVE